MRKGIVLTLMSVIIAMSFVSLTTNYQLFVSELELDRSQEVGISQTFAYMGSHMQKVSDLEVRKGFNASHTFFNFTDKGFRDSRYNSSLHAYKKMMEDHMNLSYNFDFNDTVPTKQPAFDLKGVNAEYNYSNFTKHNISILQNEADAGFIEKYEIDVGPLHPDMGVDTIDTVSETSGNLALRIEAGTSTVTTSVSRTGESIFSVSFTGSSGHVNITAGQIYGAHNSSIRMDITEKSSLNTTMVARTSELPT